jgi:sugar fermentation stimulation protein A
MTRPGTDRPTTTRPDTTRPDTTRLATARPDTARPDTAQRTGSCGPAAPRSPSIRLFTPELEARFLERPNRFLVLAEHRGRVLRTHCANPGRMAEILVPGRTLILERRPATSEGSLPYALAAARYHGAVIPLRSSWANLLAERLIIPALYPELIELRREVRLESGSRLDFLLSLPGGPLYLEVKSCTLVEEGVAMFPDARTERGLRHLAELERLAGAGSRCGVLFVVMSPRARLFVPDIHTDPELSAALSRLQGKVEMHAATIAAGADGSARLRNRKLPIDLAPAGVALSDRGSYLLVLRIPRPLLLPVGALGPLSFQGGYYVYVGSGMGGLTARMQRHLRRRKRLHWHIDYLLAEAEPKSVKALPIRTLQRLECSLARDVTRLGERAVPDFGSSDCRCPSHLVRFERDPLQDERFLALLYRYRNRVALGR